jgi:hypothetical protein
MKLSVALAAVFFGCFGPLVRVLQTSPIFNLCLLSVVAAVCHATTDGLNYFFCSDSKPLKAADSLLLPWLLFLSRCGLLFAYAILPVSVVLPLFFSWVPLSGFVDLWDGSKNGRNVFVDRKQKQKAILVVGGIVCLLLSVQGWRRSNVILALVATLVASVSTAFRMTWLRHHVGYLDNSQKVAVQNVLLGIVGCVLFLAHPTVTHKVTFEQCVILVAYGLGMHVAYLSVFEGFESQYVIDTSYNLLVELVVATVLSAAILNEWSFDDNKIYLNAAGIAAIATSVVY